MRLSQQLRTAGETLADRIEHGVYCDTTEAVRHDLRRYSLELLGWGDVAAEIEEQLRPRSAREMRVVHLAPALAVVDGGRVA